MAPATAAPSPGGAAPPARAPTGTALPRVIEHVSQRDAVVLPGCAPVTGRSAEVAIEHGVGPKGTTATVSVDGQVVGEVSFHGPGRGDSVTFGEVATFDQLGDGSHTLRLQVDEADGRQQSAYVDSLVADEFLAAGASAEASSADTSLASASPLRGPGTLVLLGMALLGAVALLRRRIVRADA